MTERIILPIEKWPAIDRKLWQVAREPRAFLEEPGGAAHWSDLTAKTRLKAYGVWLKFLNNEGWLNPETTPSERATEHAIRAWHKDLSRRNAAVTVAGRLTALLVVLKVLQPNADPTYLTGLARRLTRSAVPSRSKHSRLVHPADILVAVEPLLHELRANHARYDRKQLTTLRNALILAVMTFLPVRLQNHANMKLGINLIRNRDHYDVFFSAQETKTKRPFTGILPSSLTNTLDIYLDEVRPRLLADQKTDGVWASYRYGRLSSQTIYTSTKALTAELLGIAINPHLLRDTAATWFAVEDPKAVRASAAILGHTSLRTTQKHYNQAQMLEAVRMFQMCL